MQNDKYKVFKIDDFLTTYNALKDKEDMKTLNRLDLDDAVVIRRQDIFAAPALYAYSASISTSVAILKGTRPLVRDIPEALERINKEIGHLEELAYFFHEQADKSFQDGSKVPD